MKRFTLLIAVLVGLIMVSIPVGMNSSVSSGRVTFTFQAPDVDVELVGDMNDWDGETMLWSDDDGYFYLEYTLAPGDYEFYLNRGGDAVNVMYYIEEDIEPKPDYYVDDGYSGLNAVVKVETRTKVRFTYTPPDVWDCFDSELDNSTDSDDLELVIVKPGSSNSDYPMSFDSGNNSYSTTVRLDDGYAEFYFNIADDPINNMRKYDGLFEPEEDGYIDDGYGGYNAIVKVD